MGKKSQNANYDAAIGKAGRVVKILVCIFILLVIALLGRSMYSFGYDVFNQKPKDTELTAEVVSLTITKDMSVGDVGKLLKKEKLIEKPSIFWIQEKLSDYQGEIKPGKYTVTTAQTVDEMLKVFATQENAEGETQS